MGYSPWGHRVGHNGKLSIRSLDVQEQEKMNISDQEEREFVPPFHLFGLSIEYEMPTSKVIILSLLIQIQISSRNNCTDTPRNNVSPALW